jgi:hypothetical protein
MRRIDNIVLLFFIKRVVIIWRSIFERARKEGCMISFRYLYDSNSITRPWTYFHAQVKELVIEELLEMYLFCVGHFVCKYLLQMLF